MNENSQLDFYLSAPDGNLYVQRREGHKDSRYGSILLASGFYHDENGKDRNGNPLGPNNSKLSVDVTWDNFDGEKDVSQDVDSTPKFPFKPYDYDEYRPPGYGGHSYLLWKKYKDGGSPEKGLR